MPPVSNSQPLKRTSCEMWTLKSPENKAGPGARCAGPAYEG